MFVVRSAQLLALDEAADSGGPSALVTRARAAWPKQAEHLGPERFREQVEEASAAAERHGFRERSHVWTYVNVTLALGPGFVDDPKYPWARALLTQRQLPLEAKAELLVQRTQAELSKER
ncbi:hypothetical protein ACN469_36030 [Corallococcus terminator]